MSHIRGPEKAAMEVLVNGGTFREVHQAFIDAKDAERLSALPRCDRCRLKSEEIAKHPYWPIYALCPDCVQVLLEIHFPPFIETAPGDFYTCRDEAEWHQLRKAQTEVRQ